MSRQANYQAKWNVKHSKGIRKELCGACGVNTGCEGIIQFRRIYLFFYIQFIFQYVSHIHYVTFIDNLFQEILEIRMGLKLHI